MSTVKSIYRGDGMRPGTCFKITPVSRGVLIYIMISCLVVSEKKQCK